jgi:hypothetical protein
MSCTIVAKSVRPRTGNDIISTSSVKSTKKAKETSADLLSSENIETLPLLRVYLTLTAQWFGMDLNSKSEI